jgi:hypothetical protein
VQRQHHPLIAAVADDLDPGVVGGDVDLVRAWKRTPPSRCRGPTRSTCTSSPARSAAGAGYGSPFDARRAGRWRFVTPARSRISSIVRSGGTTAASLDSSQAIAGAPTCAHGFSSSRLRTSSTCASTPAAVRFTTRFGARERPSAHAG